MNNHARPLNRRQRKRVEKLLRRAAKVARGISDSTKAPVATLVSVDFVTGDVEIRHFITEDATQAGKGGSHD